MSENNKSSKNLSIDCPLTKENYALWKFKMMPFLSDEGLGYISTDANGIQTVRIENTNRAMRALTLNLSNEIATEVMNLQNAQDIWDHFENSFSGTSYSRKLLGIQKLCSFRHKQSSVRATISELRTIVNETITAANERTIDFEELAVAMLVNSMPDEYSSVRSRIVAEKETKLETVLLQLVKEEEIINARRAHNENFVGMAHREWPPGTKMCEHRWDAKSCFKCDPSKRKTFKARELIFSSCKDCGEKGHKSKFSTRCSKNEVSNRESALKESGIAAMVHDFPVSSEQELVPFREHALMTKPAKASQFKRKQPDTDLRMVIDSGCSTSLIKNKKIMTNYQNSLSYMKCANESSPSLHCEGNGNIQINSQLALKDVLYCPNVTMNLLSVSQLTDLGCTVTFDKNKCVVKHNETKQIMMTGSRQGNLYIYSRTPHGQAFLSKENNITRMELLHRRMGHINYRDLRQLARVAEGITIERNAAPECVKCIESKMHRKNFESSKSNAKRFGEIVHSDVCYIGTPSLNGNCLYYVSFVDDATRYLTIHLLKEKSEVKMAFIQYDKIVVNQTGRHVQTIKSDQGGEYISRGFQS